MTTLRRVVGGVFLAEWKDADGQTVRHFTGERDFDRARSFLRRMQGQSMPRCWVESTTPIGKTDHLIGTSGARTHGVPAGHDAKVLRPGAVATTCGT